MAISKSVGIKLYDDTFVPVLKVDELKNKKLILTTVRDNQKKTIIELYEGTSNKCINNEYLGKLVIPVERSTKKGKPAIEVHLRLDESGILYAKAWDTESGEQSEIQIEHSHKERIKPETLSDKEIGDLEHTATEVASYPEEEKDTSQIVKTAILISAIVILLGLLGIGIFFGVKKLGPIIKNYFASKIGETTDTHDVKDETIITDDQDIETEEIIEEETEEIQEEIIGIKDISGKKYYIKWGDNLWNICKKHYGDPWYYPALADANPCIINPRLIYADTYIIIPAKSDLNRWEIVE